MVSSSAKTVEQYIKELPPERAKDIKAVREVVLKNLPKGYEEAMNWGVITYQIPLKDYPNTYNKQPLAIAALASQKNYNAIYLMTVYGQGGEAAFKEKYKATGKKLDMGKSCVRFKKIDDLPLELIGETIAAVTPKEYIKLYEASRRK